MLAVNFKGMNPNPNKMKYRGFDQNLESSKSRNRFTDLEQYEKILSVKINPRKQGYQVRGAQS